MYAVQEGIRIAKGDKEAKAYLFTLMNELESVSVWVFVHLTSAIIHMSCLQIKTIMKDEEALTNDIVGQAHIETVALKVFALADTEDRAARFSK